MSTEKTPAQAAAVLQKEVRQLQQIFTAPHFIAFIEVMGEGSNGESFSHNLTLDMKDPEFKEMLNAYGARKSAQIMDLMSITPAPKPVVNPIPPVHEQNNC